MVRHVDDAWMDKDRVVEWAGVDRMSDQTVVDGFPAEAGTVYATVGVDFV